MSADSLPCTRGEQHLLLASFPCLPLFHRGGRILSECVSNGHPNPRTRNSLGMHHPYFLARYGTLRAPRFPVLTFRS